MYPKHHCGELRDSGCHIRDPLLIVNSKLKLPFFLQFSCIDQSFLLADPGSIQREPPSPSNHPDSFIFTYYFPAESSFWTFTFSLRGRRSLGGILDLPLLYEYHAHMYISGIVKLASGTIVLCGFLLQYWGNIRIFWWNLSTLNVKYSTPSISGDRYLHKSGYCFIRIKFANGMISTRIKAHVTKSMATAGPHLLAGRIKGREKL